MINPEQPRYSMLIQWSNEDNTYLVTLPEWQNEIQDVFTHGDTYEEAAKNGRECLEFLTKSARELGDDLPEPDVHISKDEAKEIESKWEELFASPESHAFMEKMKKEVEADREAGRLIPGGFNGLGEFTEELEAAVKALIGRVRQGMMVRDQEALTREINGFLSELTEEEPIGDMEITASGNIFADLGLPDPQGHLRVAERFRMLDNNGDFATFYQGYYAGKEDAKDEAKIGLAIHTAEDFERINVAMNALLNIVGDNENHLLANILDELANQVKTYSDIPEITDFTGFQRGLFYQRGTDHFSMKKLTEGIDSSIGKFIEHGEELRKTLKSGEKCTEIEEE